MATAGEMISAGDLAGAIARYRREGSSAAGWRAAERWLRERHPDSDQRSIDAVLAQAREVVQVGGRYKRAGPGYTIDPADVPDVRYLQRPPSLPPGQPPRPDRESYYQHISTVSIFDPQRPGRVLQTFSITTTSRSPLSQSQWMEAIQTRAEEYVQLFGESEHRRGRRQRISYELSLEGIFRGFGGSPIATP